MWVQELGLVYEEWRGISVDQTPHTKGIQTPQLANPNLSFRNVKLGTPEPNMAASSVAGNVQFGNPFEQEENIQDKPVSLATICNEIDTLYNSLDSSSPTDRVALMVLGRLKSKIKLL